MKKKILALSMVAICMSVVAYGTLAYYTASETAENVITSGNVGIELLEWADADRTISYEEMYPDNIITDVMPGTDVTKVVEVKNSGDNPVWVRVSVDKQIIMDEQMDEEADTGLMTMDFDTDNWSVGNDGYFYYTLPVAPGASTEGSLLTCTVKYPNNPEYTLSVEILAEAIQSVPEDAVKAAWGAGFSIGADGSLIVPGN